MTISVSIQQANYLHVDITWGEFHSDEIHAQGLQLLDSMLIAFPEHFIIIHADTHLASADALDELSKKLAGRIISFSTNMPVSSQVQWVQYLAADTKLALSQATSKETATLIAKTISYSESLLYDDLAPDVQCAITDAFLARQKEFDVQPSYKLPAILAMLKHPHPDRLVRLRAGRARPEDYAAIIRAVPRTAILWVPKSTDSALCMAIKALASERRLTLESDISVDVAVLIVSYLPMSCTLLLPADMSFDVQQAIAAHLPRGCTLVLSAHTTLAQAKAIAELLKPGLVLAVPNRLLQEDGMLCESHDWLAEIESLLKPRFCDLKLPTGIAIEVLQTWVENISIGSSIVLSEEMTSAEIAILAPAIRKAGGNLKLTGDISTQALEALGAGREDEGMGLSVCLHPRTSIASAKVVVSMLGRRDILWLAHSLMPIEYSHQTDMILEAYASVIGDLAAGQSLGFLTGLNNLPLEGFAHIIKQLPSGVILRPASYTQEHALRVMAQTLQPGCIFEIPGTLLNKRKDICLSIAGRLTAGVLLRLPRKPGFQNMRDLQAVMQPGAILDLSAFGVNFLDRICAWIKTLRAESVIAFSDYLVKEIKQQYFNTFFFVLPEEIRTSSMHAALESAALQACHEVLMILVKTLPNTVNIVLSSDVDDATKQVLSSVLSPELSSGKGKRLEPSRVSDESSSSSTPAKRQRTPNSGASTVSAKMLHESALPVNNIAALFGTRTRVTRSASRTRQNQLAHALASDQKQRP